jgi:hypothetical protein
MLLLGRNHRPDCLVFPAVGKFDVRSNAQRTARRSLVSRYLQTQPHVGWTLSRTMFKLNLGAWSCVGANGQPGSLAIGNILMLLMKPLPAQGGNREVFHIREITKVWNRLFPSAFMVESRSPWIENTR